MSSETTPLIKGISDIWKTLCNDLTTDETEYSSVTLAAHAGLKMPGAGRALRFLRGLGLVSYRSEYNGSVKGGQRVFMKVTTTVDEGLTAIYRHFDAGRSYSWFEAGNPGNSSTSSKVTIATKPTEVTRAIAGPEPEAPMRAALQPVRRDEGEALIEAARQYANRGAAVQAKIGELAALGVTVDADMLAKAIHYEPDERLELVATILPIIDRLYRTNERLTTEVAGLKSELKNTSEMRAKVLTLEAANKRLSERNVKLQAVATTVGATLS